MTGKCLLLSIFIFFMYFNALYASHELVRVEENQSSHLSSRVITNEITVNIMTYLSIEDLGRA